jgi:phosphoglycolate phosphatase-like HAD superfamily hydrolase
VLDTSGRPDQPRGIIFDLDGTLADTLPVCFDAYRLAFAKYVDHEWTDDQISALFGPSEEGVIRQVVPTRAEECLEEYLRYHDRCPLGYERSLVAARRRDEKRPAGPSRPRQPMARRVRGRMR